MIRRFILSVFLLFATALDSSAFPPKPPYDPRPLMDALAKKTSTDKFRFIVMGDTKCCGGFVPVVAQAERVAPDFVLWTGDMVPYGIPKRYDTFEQQAGAFMRKVPCWPCYGNHEAEPREGWPNFCAFYGIHERHFAFDFRNARFIQLRAEASTTQVRGSELQWLEAQLAEGKKLGKLLFVWQHCPCYSIGRKGPREVPNRPTPMTQLLTKYGVVANFAGHDHLYYRTKRDGVHYIVQGAGGAGLYGANRRADALETDVWYATIDRKPVLHTAKGIQHLDKVLYALTVIEVDGPKVTGKTMFSNGTVFDAFVLREGDAPKP